MLDEDGEGDETGNRRSDLEGNFLNYSQDFAQYENRLHYRKLLALVSAVMQLLRIGVAITLRSYSPACHASSPSKSVSSNL